MFNGKGLPKEKDVTAILSWPVWQVDGQFNHELFRSFSGMLNGKRLPKEAEVKALLSWPVWQVDGQFNYELLRAFSSMFNGKGLPCEEYVMACVSWLSGADGQALVAPDQMSALFAIVFAKHKTSGIPDIGRLVVYERRLLQLLPADMQEDDLSQLQIKQLALYAASKKENGLLALEMFEHFLKGGAGCWQPHSDSKAGPVLIQQSLSRLLTLLIDSGCQGVRTFLAAADEKGQEMSRHAYDE